MVSRSMVAFADGLRIVERTNGPGRVAMNRDLTMGAAASLVTAGCAEVHTPDVDLKGADPAKYEADLAQCRDEAKLAVAEESPAPIFAGALLLGLLGAALGSLDVRDSPGTGAARGAAIFGALGAAPGGAAVASKQADAASTRAGIIDGCLRSRGYTVRL